MRVIEILIESKVVMTLVIWPLLILIGWLLMHAFDATQVFSYHPPWALEWILIWLVIPVSVSFTTAFVFVFVVGIAYSFGAAVYRDLLDLRRRIRDAKPETKTSS